jgi:hypothetical protein
MQAMIQPSHFDNDLAFCLSYLAITKVNGGVSDEAMVQEQFHPYLFCIVPLINP